MSTVSEITRLETARNLIRNKLVDLGLSEAQDKLDALATVIDAIANRGAPSAQVKEGESYTIQPGYYRGGTVQGVAGGGHYELQAKSFTPTKTQTVVSPDSGYYGLSGVTVAAIPDAYQDVSSVSATAADVLSTKIIVTADGTVTPGTMPNIGAVSQVLTPSAASYTVPKGYHNGNGTVSIVPETKDATPTKEEQEIVPTTGKVLSKVTIDPIPDEYQDVTGVTAVAGHVLDGDIFVDADGEEVEGTMPNNGKVTQALDATTGKQSYTIPAGYHNGQGTVSITLEEKSATPTKAAQDVTATTGKVLSKVTIDPIPDEYQDVTGVTAVAGHVLDGDIFVDADGEEVEGTMPNNGAVSKTLDATSGNQTYTVPAGYHNGSGTVKITLEEKSATPTTSAQNVTPTAGKVLSKVTVAAIPAIYGNATNADAAAANILAGKKAVVKVNNAASLVTGTMANNGAIAGTIDGLTTTSYTIAEGYTNGGTVSLTDDIENALAAI